MKRRIYLRTLWFVAYNWAPPFFAGMAASMVVAWWDMAMVVEAFEYGVNAAVATCAP